MTGVDNAAVWTDFATLSKYITDTCTFTKHSRHFTDRRPTIPRASLHLPLQIIILTNIIFSKLEYLYMLYTPARICM